MTRRHALIAAALAQASDHWEGASDAEVVEAFKNEGASIRDEAERVRSVLLAAVERAKKRRDNQNERNEMKPSIGRIVHYTNLGDRDGKYPPTVQAAIITGVNDDGTAALHVFYKTGQFDLTSAAFTEAEAGSEDARGKWGWPART